MKNKVHYLRLLENPRDDVSLLRILNVPARGIGDSAEEVIIQAAKIRGLSLYETIKQLAGEGVPRLSGKLSGFVELIQGLGVSLVDARLDRVVEVIAERIGYFAYLTKKFPEQASDKEDNVMELASALSEYASIEPNAKIADWLQSVSLASDVTGDGNGVTMMTLHMAKGLEFERVYLVGLEEGLLPHFNSEDDLQKLEEERRLLYVGMTRAKKKLSLLAAQTRVNWGQYVSNSVSRFLREIPNKHLNVLSDVDNEQEVEAPRVKSPIADEDGQYYDYGDESSEDMVEPGAHVYHPTYGSGIVETIEMNWGKPKVVVRFQDFGLRRVDGRHLEVSR